MKVNLPTKLTFLRLALIPFYLGFIIQEGFISRSIALAIFVIASLTDLYDGKLARQRNMVTTLGTFLDPLADKLLISAAFVAFVQVKDFTIPAWMVVLIISREFLINGLRTLAVSQGRILPAQPAGKFKTTSQIVAIIAINLIMILHSYFTSVDATAQKYLFNPEGFWSTLAWIMRFGPMWLVLAVTVLTIYSGALYIHNNIDLFHEKNVR